MKTKILHLMLAAFAALPQLVFAQGTYLSAPDGNPAKPLFIGEDGNVAIFFPLETNQVFTPAFLLDVSDYREASTVRTVAEFTSNAQGVGSGTAIVIGVGADRGVYSTKIAAVTEGLPSNFANRALTFSLMHNTVYLGSEVERMRITSDGKVGIGTTSPTRTLHVARPQAAGNSTRIAVDDDNNNDPGIEWLTDGDRKWLLYRPAQSSDLSLYQGGYGPRVTFQAGGNVGIGTQNPRATLDVNGKINCIVLELTCDRNQKQDFAAVDSRRVLDRLVGLPIQTWAYTNDAQVRRIGPMAQDWKAAYPELGSDDKHIAAGDLSSVALAAIQGLNAKLTESLKEKDAEIAALKNELIALKTDQANFAARFEKLEKVLAQSGSGFGVPASAGPAPIHSERLESSSALPAKAGTPNTDAR